MKPYQKPKWTRVWESKRVEDMELSDFSMYDDDIEPFMFSCARFLYKNKAQIIKDEQINVAMDEYEERRRNLSAFDAIASPEIAGLCGGLVPLPITDDRRVSLTPLCMLALDTYNAENQGANFVLTDVVNTTWKPSGVYSINFQAQDISSNTSATTFQAKVLKKRVGPHQVLSCAIQT
ncbi:uncharacterized protein LOC131655886 [Vicia villosa]|uniref:uncharacterized protein LOC131655886 n=1 Tax=Vicia villosa TaxID=3911 RepID=UPI00273C7C86|nr:uncharacterized protein LOC131655886 [Vicia villosa]